MLKMRTINEAIAEIKASDPNTALTKYALRQLVTTGRIPCVELGKKKLVSMETLNDYLKGGLKYGS